MVSGTPPAEHPMDEQLVRRLLSEQHADLAELSLELADVGWDNSIYRLGDELAVRLPRRKEAVPLVVHEQTWLPQLRDQLPLPIPAPLRVGQPSAAYPWPWSIVPWLPGEAADLAPPRPAEARPLIEFLQALHRPAPRNAPENPLRGVPLATRAERVDGRLKRLAEQTEWITPAIRALWQQALDAAPAPTAYWLHGDLHSRNVLVAEGQLSGIIDWGDITSGDVATDLASIWMLFDDAAARRACLDAYEATADQRARAQGWAIFYGTTFLETGLIDHPRHAAMGEAILRRLTQDA